MVSVVTTRIIELSTDIGGYLTCYNTFLKDLFALYIIVTNPHLLYLTWLFHVVEK